MSSITINRLYIALLLCGSAIFLFSCAGALSETDIDASTTPTMEADSLIMKYSENGNLSYSFTTAKMFRYETKDSVYMLFKDGVYVETYNDSTKQVMSTLSAKSAIYNETKESWVVTGDVIGKNLNENKTLYTEVLFWNQADKKIYSNVRSKIVDGEEQIVGFNGFNANEDLSDVVFINTIGRIFMDTTSSPKVNQPKEVTESKNEKKGTVVNKDITNEKDVSNFIIPDEEKI